MTKTSTSASSPAAQTGSAGERPTSYKLDHLRELEAEVIYVIREVAVHMGRMASTAVVKIGGEGAQLLV